MKKSTIILALSASLFLAGNTGADYNETFTTGKNWSQRMSPREKYMSLLPPVFVMNEYDVHLRHGLPQYITWMDRILQRNPQLEAEDVSTIFASTVFFLEPENRTALRAMESEFLRGDYTPMPRLSIDEVLQEVSPES